MFAARRGVGGVSLGARGHGAAGVRRGRQAPLPESVSGRASRQGTPLYLMFVVTLSLTCFF